MDFPELPETIWTCVILCLSGWLTRTSMRIRSFWSDDGERGLFYYARGQGTERLDIAYRGRRGITLGLRGQFLKQDYVPSTAQAISTQPAVNFGEFVCSFVR